MNSRHFIFKKKDSNQFLLRFDVTAQWRLDTAVTDDCLYLLFLYWVFVFGYELYDLKNCWDIKMMSGVVHHLVLLVIIPMNWVRYASTLQDDFSTHQVAFLLALSILQPITLIAIPSVWMTATTYLTNIPAHLRSFMVHTGESVLGLD